MSLLPTDENDKYFYPCVTIVAMIICICAAIMQSLGMNYEHDTEVQAIKAGLEQRYDAQSGKTLWMNPKSNVEAR